MHSTRHAPLRTFIHLQVAQTQWHSPNHSVQSHPLFTTDCHADTSHRSIFWREALTRFFLPHHSNFPLIRYSLRTNARVVRGVDDALSGAAFLFSVRIEIARRSKMPTAVML